MEAPSVIELEIPSTRTFLASTFREVQREDLFRWMDERALTDSLFEATVRLALVAGGEVTLPAQAAAGLPERGRLGVLIGRRRHLKLKRAAWQLLLGTIPLLVSSLMAATSPGELTGAIVNLLLSITGNLERLEPEEWEAYLSVRTAVAEAKGPVPRKKAVQALPRGKGRRDQEAIYRLLDKMVAKGVLEERDGRLNTVF